MKKQNVIFITCDQLQKKSLGIYGNKIVKTPNIDELFEDGVVFNQMFCAAPVCAPNRGAIATGRWPRVNGLVYNGFILPETETTMMEVFRRNGYGTYGIGKMHFEAQWAFDMDADSGRGALNPQPEKFPHYGYEKGLFTEDNRIGPYADYLQAHGFDPWADIHSFTKNRNHKAETSIYPEEHSQTTWITDRTIDFLNGHDFKRPMFAWVSYVDPHHPFNPPKLFDTMYDPADMPLPIYKEGEFDNRPDVLKDRFSGNKRSSWGFAPATFTDRQWQELRASYYGMISLIDKGIGRVVETLKRLGQYDNTIFVLTADHGEMIGDHHLLFKGFPFDEVTNVPFLVKMPAMKKRKDVDVLCRSLEIMPTLLELACIKPPSGLHGVSLADQITGAAHELFEYIHMEQDLTRDMDGWKTLRSKKYRLTVYPPETCPDRPDLTGELYDLVKDPNCFSNLWRDPACMGIKDRLFAELAMRLGEVRDPKFNRVHIC